MSAEFKLKLKGGHQLRLTKRPGAPLQERLRVQTFTVFVGSCVKVDPEPPAKNRKVETIQQEHCDSKGYTHLWICVRN